MKVSELKSRVTYILCPDKTCRLFWQTDGPFPCEGHCPHEAKQKLIIRCHNCDGMIILDGGHCILCNIPHDCPNGDRPICFRMDHAYHLLYELPVI